MDSEYMAEWIVRDRLREHRRRCARERAVYGGCDDDRRLAGNQRALVAGTLIHLGQRIARWGEGLRDGPTRDAPDGRTPADC